MSNSAAAAAAAGRLEERLDLSSETDDKIAQAKQLVATSSSQLAEALALLSALEKRCRTGNDNASLARVCTASLQLCKDANEPDEILNTLQTLATRRSQKTSAVKALVTTALPWCVAEPYAPLPVSTKQEEEARNKLVVALRDISDGKIFLERERAIFTRVLATIKEQEGDISTAADILQEVHVETYGSLSKRDKVEFILEQMRLTLAKRDFVRAHVVASKISKKQLVEENMQEYKVRFYELMTIYHRHDKDALELAKDYYAIYLTPSVLADEALWMPALASTALFLVLAPHGNEQQDMMHRLVMQDDNKAHLEKLPACHAVLKLFLKKEIINYPMTPHQQELEALPAFTDQGGASEPLAPHWRDALHRRVIQHNIRTVSLYYKRIHGARLAQLLQLPADVLEQEIATMVSDGTVSCKIDRPCDIIRFLQAQTPEAILTDWAADIDTLLHLVETTTHLIHKENMMIAKQ